MFLGTSNTHTNKIILKHGMNYTYPCIADIQGCYHDQMDILHQIVINNDYDEAIIQTKLLSLQRREFDVTAGTILL